MARRCGLDAGHHVIEYAAVRFCGNENEDRWDSLNDFTHKAIPDWDSPGLIDIFDGKHGAVPGAARICSSAATWKQQASADDYCEF